MLGESMAELKLVGRGWAIGTVVTKTPPPLRPPLSRAHTPRSPNLVSLQAELNVDSQRGFHREISYCLQHYTP
jgi:hypothetical protein